MARKAMVTRTILTTKVNVLCMDVKTCEPCNIDVSLPRTYKDDKKLLKKVQELVDNDEVKAVHIVSKEEVETLYGMTEQRFIEGAIILDPKTRKMLEEESENDDEDEVGTPSEAKEQIAPIESKPRNKKNNK